MPSRGRACLYVPALYPVVSGGRVPGGGGIEVQLSHLARGLVRRGFDVSVVTCDYGQAPVEVVDGVRLLRAWKPLAGLPVVRFFHPRLSLATRALWSADADVYVFQGAGMWAGFTYDLARLKGRGYVFVAAHDHDLLPNLPDVEGWRDRSWYRRGLAGADTVIVQTAKQLAMLRRDFGRDGVVVMNPVNVPGRRATPGASRRIVWLATYKAAKRPEWFTRFAERHPEFECVMVGVIPPPPLTDAEFRAAQEVAARSPNLSVHPTIPHERVGELMEGAALFTHTSPAEGFPNVFLEAWSWGVPSVTCFDPDGIQARERLGEKHDTYEAWEAAVVRWMADPEERDAAGARARAYAERAHGSGEIHDRFAEELDQVIAKRRRSG